VTYAIPVIAGLMYRDSVEIDEFKYPIQIRSQRLVAGSGGAGRQRGAPRQEVVYGPTSAPMTAMIPADGQTFPARGVQGGKDGNLGASFLIDEQGVETRLPNVVRIVVQPGQWLRGVDTSGGGYGDPLERDPRLVVHDVLERWETVERAQDIYGVVLTGNVEEEALAVDEDATALRRSQLRRDLQ
jgi:N-methylhydantoinase B